MPTLKVLIVDDDRVWSENFKSNLTTAVTPASITGRDYDGFEVTWVTNQADADKAVGNRAGANNEASGGQMEYDLVFLDLRYPLQPKDESEDEPADDEEDEFQGMKWLHELRRLQPNATIIIMTSHSEAGDPENVVAAVRDHDANDFILKTEHIGDIVPRIRLAWENARRMRLLLMLEEEFRALLRTRAARTYAEDVAAILGQTKTSLYRIAQRIESGDPSAIATAANDIRSEFNSLNKEFMELTNLLNEGQERRAEVGVAATVRQMLLLYQRMIESVHAKAVPPVAEQDVRLVTYEGDFKVALHEAIANAVDSLEHSRTPAKERWLSVEVEKVEGGAVVRVRDNGDGFSNEAMDRMFEPGYTTKGDQHKGLGLYIARRMMHQIGGEIVARNREEGGAEVELMVKNLGAL
jgi:signal transduction histidine kinase